MRKIILACLIFAGCAGNELNDLGKYQDQQDLNRIKLMQEDRDEKLRKDHKLEHRDDVMFNLDVQQRQLSLDEKKLDMISRYGSDQSKLRAYNSTLDDERDRVENIEGQPTPDRDQSTDEGEETAPAPEQPTETAPAPTVIPSPSRDRPVTSQPLPANTDEDGNAAKDYHI